MKLPSPNITTRPIMSGIHLAKPADVSDVGPGVSVSTGTGVGAGVAVATGVGAGSVSTIGGTGVGVAFTVTSAPLSAPNTEFPL